MKAGTLAIAATVLIVVGVAIESGDSARNRADYLKARAQIAALREALTRYQADNGFYPTTDQGLSVLGEYYSDRPGELAWEHDPEMVFPRLRSVRPHPIDPWGRPYFYQSDGQAYVLKSFGPNGSRHGSNHKILVAHSPQHSSN